MKTVIKILITAILSVLLNCNVISQDIEFSQFYATKNYLNPAFTALSNDQQDVFGQNQHQDAMSFNQNFDEMGNGIEENYE